MRARVSWPRWAAAAAGVAALVLLLRPPTRDAGPDLARAIKGGDLTAQLVRARGDEVAFDPTTFTTGDTFAVRVTCAFDAEVHFELAVFMGGEVFFPWKDGGRRGRCANMSVLRGSFLLSSEEPARVCVIMSLESIDRDRVQSDKERAYPETTLCKTLAPEK